MVWWIIAVIVFALGCLLSACSRKERYCYVIVGALLAVVLFALPVGIHFGYEERVLVGEIELVSLSNDVTSEGKGTRRYVVVSAENVYTYRYEVENTYGLQGTAYEMDTVSKNVTEIESDECTRPILLVYKEEIKGEFWFTFESDRYSYVFYVPVGTISKEVKLD